MNDAEILAWRRAALGSEMVRKMGKRGFSASYVPTAAEAKAAVLALLPPAGAVALLGSQTMNQLGVFAHLRQSGRDLVDHATQSAGLSPEEADEYKRGVFSAAAMLASANAVDMDGRLYNIDGVGNRVAGMVFGPKSVILAIGLNKLASTPEEAWRRARHVASPLNNRRLNHKNPCLNSGRCHDCQTTSSICNYFAVIDRSRPEGRIKVVLVGEDLGY
ncbi:hypothetical protein FACS189460_1540 [Deltaproteobacteria bacterium]|nr:hypothetical protein FACS189460_1540 [Deltaproteobacteria bacterium]